MAIESIFLAVAVILFIGFFGEIIFEKTNIPDVIWLLLIGIILSTIFRWVSSSAFDDVAPLFTTFALIYLLFEAGINIDIKKFLNSAPQGLRLSVISFVFSFLVIFLVGLVIQKGFALSLLLGAILSGLSSAVVVPIIKNMTMDPKAKLSLVIDSAFSDVFCILGTVTLVEVFSVNVFDMGQIVNSVLSSFLIAIAVGLLLSLVWANIILKFFKKRNFYILTLAFMLIVYSVTEMIKANGAIACLVFGLILGNSKKIHKLFSEDKNVITRSGKAFYGEFAFFIKTFFFVYLGILIDFSQPLSFVWALLILVGLYLVRPFAVWLSFSKDSKIRDVKLTETLIPKGLAAAVLVQLPIQAEIAGAESLVNICLAVILLSILSATVFVYLIQKNKYPGFFRFLYRKYSKA